MSASSLFDKGDLGRAAAQRFDADGTRPGAQVQKAPVFDAIADDIEQRLSQAVRGRSDVKPIQRFQSAAFVFSGNDAHFYPTKRMRGSDQRKSASSAFHLLI